MLVMKKARAAWMVVMNVMLSNFMAGLELYRDSFNGLSIKCNTVDLFKWFSGLHFSFV